MKVEQSGFSPLNIQDVNNIQKVQPSAPQGFPDISKTKPAEEVSQQKPMESLQFHAPTQGSSLSQYLNQEEKDMINRLFPGGGKHAGIQAYRQTQAPVQPQENILGQRIDITT